MDPKIITSFFTNNGAPALGLTPTIKIWEINGASNTLIVVGGAMIEVGDGFYKYSFVTYDPKKDYLFRTDGGSTLPISERYQDAANGSVSSDAAYLTWEEQRSDHVTSGSTGEGHNIILADVTQLRLDVTNMYALIDLLVKCETNRSKIDKVAKTLTIYDNDSLTPIHVFNLYDSTGTPSTSEVCERVPQ